MSVRIHEQIIEIYSFGGSYGMYTYDNEHGIPRKRKCCVKRNRFSEKSKQRRVCKSDR